MNDEAPMTKRRVTEDFSSFLICHLRILSSFVIRISSLFLSVSVDPHAGLRASRSAVSRHWHNCVSLLLRRSRRRVGLHRGDDLVGTCAHRYSADCARTQHPGGLHRLVSVL